MLKPKRPDFEGAGPTRKGGLPWEKSNIDSSNSWQEETLVHHCQQDQLKETVQVKNWNDAVMF